ncbi:zinc finger BED domain-containing protein 4-like [Uloborus diversus]|uniref:zinc finger BED domain-containing protein 4-like n=1 Tax=Uloborus diversus TaxID=327109 RepID=UPI00240A57D0|nr:zinc finger BED domain-containing protein 4-like [Uloborus diversus]
MSTKKFSSIIWRYFVVVNDERAKCKICDADYSRKGKGTTSLKKHLQRKHPEEYDLFLKEDSVKKKTDDIALPGTSLQTEDFDKLLWMTKNWGSDDHVVPNYVLKGRKYFTELVCSELYDKVSSKIKNMLQDFEKVSFTSDIWSDSSSGVSLLSLTCHGITKDFIRKNIVLKADILEERHTGDYISALFQSMLEEWGIPKQNVHCMVRDGGSNMKLACTLSEINNIDCTAHQLNLVFKDAIKKVDAISLLLTKCRKIAGHFNHSTVAKQELEKLLDCTKDSLSFYSSNNKIEQLNAEEWVLIRDLVKVLKPLEDTTKKLSSQNVCVSDVIPLVRALTKIYDEIGISDINGESVNINSAAAVDFVCSLKNELDHRFSEIDKNILFQLATFLDPRYKSKFFSDLVIKDIKQKLLTALETEVSPTTTATSTEKSNSVRKEPCNSLEESMANMLDSDDDDGELDYQISDAKANFLAEYSREKRLSRDQDPLKYWQINSNRLVELSRIARTYLTSPATSVPSEQFFSAAGIVYDPHRNRLLGDKAAKLFFLKIDDEDNDERVLILKIEDEYLPPSEENFDLDSENESENNSENAVTVAGPSYINKDNLSDVKGKSNIRRKDKQRQRNFEKEPTRTFKVGNNEDGTVWNVAEIGIKDRGRKSKCNVLKEVGGPTAHAKRNVIDSSLLSAWKLFVDEWILKHIEKFTEDEAQRQTHNREWSITLEEIDTFVAILYARGIYCEKGLELDSL